MTVFNCRKLESELLNRGLIEREALVALVAESRRSGKRVVRLILEKRMITEEQLLTVLESELGIEQVNLSLFPVDQQVIARFPAEVNTRLGLVAPATRLRLDASGRGCPHGHTVT